MQAGVYDSFVEKLAVAVAALKVGDGTHEGVSQGPLIDIAAIEKVEAHIADALDKGARLVAGGKRHALGYSFFEPTIIADATPHMDVAREETFGPLASLFSFNSEDEVVAMANDSEFGLAAYFYAKDVGRIMRVAKKIEAGMVAVNSGLLSTEVAPFGGVKQSGIGREGSFMGLEDYIETKYVLLTSPA